MSCAEAVSLMSLSKARANAKKYSQVLVENEGKKSNGMVQSPDVRDEHGVHIHVSDYKTKLKEGMIVKLEVILKLWTIKPCRDNPNPRNVNGSRVSQIMLQHMQILPCTKYTQPVFVDSLKDKKGKRKVMDETTGQSPTKKGSFTDVPDEDEDEYTMVKVGDWRWRRYNLELMDIWNRPKSTMHCLVLAMDLLKDIQMTIAPVVTRD
ncbi:hypothetical protein DFH29DRAFT_872713 [Suillus ampliporus]|nr:hypothetical protein DFH29DRAFT_872713 [Suillus ampliporus]